MEAVLFYYLASLITFYPNCVNPTLQYINAEIKDDVKFQVPRDNPDGTNAFLRDMTSYPLP